MPYGMKGAIVNLRFFIKADELFIILLCLSDFHHLFYLGFIVQTHANQSFWQDANWTAFENEKIIFSSTEINGHGMDIKAFSHFRFWWH